MEVGMFIVVKLEQHMKHRLGNTVTEVGMLRPAKLEQLQKHPSDKVGVTAVTSFVQR